MRIYTEVNFIWDDKQGKLVETSSKSFDYQGELALCDGAWYDSGTVKYDSVGNKYTMSWYKYTGWRKGISTIKIFKNGELVHFKKLGGRKHLSSGVGRMETFVKNADAAITGTTGKFWSSEESYLQNFKDTFGFLPSDDKAENAALIKGAHAEGLFKDGVYIGDLPEWADDLVAGSGRMFPEQATNIARLLEEFREITDPTVPDDYTEELSDAVKTIKNIGLVDAKKAMTTFEEDLAEEWNLFEAQEKSFEDKYRAGDTWTDLNNDGVVDDGELTESDGQAGLTAPGTAIQQAVKTYGTAMAGPTNIRDAALRDLATEYGDYFIDENDNNIKDTNEEWGDMWDDADGNQQIDPGELTTSSEASARGYQEGTEQDIARGEYQEVYDELYGRGEEGVDDDWMEGTYYRDKRLAEEAKAEGLEDVAYSRGETFAAFREEARSKISEASAAIAGQGFSSSGVGFTAREQLAQELGAHASEIEEDKNIERADVVSAYDTDVSGIEERTTAAFSTIEGDLASALGKYYTNKKTGAEDAVTAFNTSEQSAAFSRDTAITDAAETLDDPLTGIPGQQAAFAKTAGTFKETWKGEAETFREMLIGYGADIGDWKGEESAFLAPFDVEVTAEGGTTTERAEAAATDIATDIETYLMETRDPESPYFSGKEQFHLFEDPLSPFAKPEYADLAEILDYDPDEPGGGFFRMPGLDDPGTIFDPGAEYKSYDPGTDWASWLYEPTHIMPWQKDDYIGEWRPSTINV